MNTSKTDIDIAVSTITNPIKAHVNGFRLLLFHSIVGHACSGGIIGLGETVNDRVAMIKVLANMPQHPESVPVNALVPVKGTPLADQPRVAIWDMVRMIATVRITMPKTAVRLSAGRNEMSVLEQAFCFMAGANSIFAGDKLLTTPNPEFKDDMAMFELLGLTTRKAFKNGRPSTAKEEALS